MGSAAFEMGMTASSNYNREQEESDGSDGDHEEEHEEEQPEALAVEKEQTADQLSEEDLVAFHDPSSSEEAVVVQDRRIGGQTATQSSKLKDHYFGTGADSIRMLFQRFLPKRYARNVFLPTTRV